MTDVSSTYCHHFAMYTTIEPCCTSETYIMLYVNYLKKIKERRRKPFNSNLIKESYSYVFLPFLVHWPTSLLFRPNKAVRTIASTSWPPA